MSNLGKPKMHRNPSSEIPNEFPVSTIKLFLKAWTPNLIFNSWNDSKEHREIVQIKQDSFFSWTSFLNIKKVSLVTLLLILKGAEIEVLRCSERWKLDFFSRHLLVKIGHWHYCEYCLWETVKYTFQGLCILVCPFQWSWSNFLLILSFWRIRHWEICSWHLYLEVKT